MNIDWTPPELRRGLLGEWDKFIGPGQTHVEFWLIPIPQVVATFALAGTLAFKDSQVNQ